MKSNIIVALLLSAVIIGGAFWYRLNAHRNQEPNTVGLIAVKGDALPSSYYDDLIKSFTERTAPTSTSTEPTENLTTTDIVGRQLILDYMSLEQTGQATDENLQNLADKYVGSFETITSARQVLITGLNIVPDTQTNVVNYSNALGNSYANYIGQLNDVYQESASAPTNPMVTKALAQVYSEISDKLEKMPVPTGLAQLHLQLLNIFLSDVATTQAIANSDTDSTAAFAGIITFKNNAAKEQDVLQQMEAALSKYGV